MSEHKLTGVDAKSSSLSVAVHHTQNNNDNRTTFDLLAFKTAYAAVDCR